MRSWTTNSTDSSQEEEHDIPITGQLELASIEFATALGRLLRMGYPYSPLPRAAVGELRAVAAHNIMSGYSASKEEAT